jgi:acetyltransferase
MNQAHTGGSSAGEHPLYPLLNPKSIAVIGATPREGSMGRVLMQNLTDEAFGGTIYPVNPNHTQILGRQTYPTIAEVPADVDLAIIAVPAEKVAAAIRSCAGAPVRGALILSAGCREKGEAGSRLEAEIMAAGRDAGIRILGPNSFGIMNPRTGLNASFSPGMIQQGSVGFISQSGTLNVALLDWSRRNNVGFSAFLSGGAMGDVGWGELISYLGEDRHTRSIVLYMESIGNAKSFLCAARRVSRRKPIIVLKGGETLPGGHASTAFAGARIEGNEVFDAALRRSGILRVGDIESLFGMAEVLNLQPRPKGPRLSIMTNAGGLGVLAADALVKVGAELAPLPPETEAALDAVLPSHWSHANPVNVFSDGDIERYARVLEILAKNPESDGLLLVITPQVVVDVAQAVDRLRKLELPRNKPILASIMGGVGAEEGERILANAGIPNFPYPDIAARTFYYMWRHSYNLRGLYETPAPLTCARAFMPDQAQAAAVIAQGRAEGRTQLSEYESKLILAAYGIPIAETRIARDPAEATQFAGEMGYPVALKLHSTTMPHAARQRLVRLDVKDAAEVYRAFQGIEAQAPTDFAGVTVQPMVRGDGFEILCGSTVDPQFGPLILFGAGGKLSDVYRDRALALPPLNTSLAKRLMEQTRIYSALISDSNGDPVNIEALQLVLVRLSQLVVEQRRIREIAITPLHVSNDQVIALDAQIFLHDPTLTETVIRPYPVEYISETTLRDGTPVKLRPIRAEDEPLVVRFHEGLSSDTVYFRYLVPLPLEHRINHDQLAGRCFIDYDQEFGLLAIVRGPGGEEVVAGVGRLSRLSCGSDADFALTVHDAWQGRGLGEALLRKLLEGGAHEGYQRVVGTILGENRRMQNLCRKVGFRLIHGDPSGVAAIYDYANADTTAQTLETAKS